MGFSYKDVNSNIKRPLMYPLYLITGPLIYSSYSNSKSSSVSNDKSKNFNGSPSNVASGSKNITRLFNDHFTKSDDLPKPNIKSASIEGMRCEQTHPDLTELKLYPTLPQLPVETLGYSGGWFVIHL
ncbi:hypothetical protein ACTFIR_011897 [Dictyostelium discoideum]